MFSLKISEQIHFFHLSVSVLSLTTRCTCGKLLLVCLLLGGAGCWVRGQSGAVVEGVVFHSQDLSLLSGATLRITPASQSTTTRVDGRFSLSGLKKGQQYRLSISHVGMQTLDTTFVLRRNSTSIRVYLEPKLEQLDEVEAIDRRTEKQSIVRLNQVEDFGIYASKKNEVIEISKLVFNKGSNISRQLYAKVSGLNIWESDGAGIQLGIGGRGLSPNRSSNFNTRQNGYDISADALGYPESYYTPAPESIERIELVRGAASLQYGTQFGGMLNFKLKQGHPTKPLDVHLRQVGGSFGLFNTYSSVGGTVGKLNYYTFYQYKTSAGWRPNSSLDQHTAYASIQYKYSDKLMLSGDYTHMNYLAQQPGGLTDVQFEQDPRQSLRTRNWFAVDWNLASFTFTYQFSPFTQLNSRTFMLMGGRDVVGILSPINILDFGDERDFLSDDFLNFGNETRLLYRYRISHSYAALLVGGRYYRGKTERRQGLGNDGDGPDFVYLNPDDLEGSDFDLPSTNFSLFAENVINFTPQWSITPGIRYEFIRTATDGYYKNLNRDLAGNIILNERIDEAKENTRQFVLLGIGMSYKPARYVEAYMNFSQNYRAINFNDIRVNVGSLVVDEDLKDERGFNFDFGLRGAWEKYIEYDVSFYWLSYNDRIGTLLKKEPNPEFNGLVDRVVRFRTNIADARIMGIESVVDFHLNDMVGLTSDDYDVDWFINLSYTEAKYESETSIDGNAVELVPPFILKTGMQMRFYGFRMNVQYSLTQEHFSDATNARRTPTAIEGLIPSYEVVDISTNYQMGWLTVEAGANNVLNSFYFTRRATGYPGPGIIPSDGRSFYMGLDWRF